MIARDGAGSLANQSAYGCLVHKPSEVSVQAITTGELTSLQVKVAPEDIGKLIGEKGRTARSLRATISAASLERKQTFSLDILEEGCPKGQSF